MEKVLVTGANGYLGRHVVSALKEMNYSVVGVDVRSDAGTDVLVYDIFDEAKDVYADLGCPDRVIHLAWKDGFVHNAPSHLEFLPKHVAFIEKMVQGGCKSISVMGSMHEVGYFEGKIDGDTPTNPSSFYAISKNALRQALNVMKNTNDFSLKWLRGFYITGDDTKNNSIFAKILAKAETGETLFPFTSGKNKYDFISVDELALQIALASVQDEIDGVINCCSGQPVSLKDRVERFIKENNLNISLEYGKFPDRPYDSPIIYGDNKKITAVLKNAKGIFNETVDNKIQEQIKVYGK